MIGRSRPMFAIALMWAMWAISCFGASIREIETNKIAGTGNGGAVLDLGAPGAFDSVWVTCPTVIFDGQQYRMWYSSFYDSHMGRGGIGMATSRDGIHWRRANHGHPVLTLGRPGAFDDGQIMGPSVLRDHGIYRMWYTGMTKVWHASGIGFYRIGMATSADGIHWTRQNGSRPVLDVGPGGSYDEVQAATPTVLPEGGGYRMWYAGWSPKTGHTIESATSTDGVHWKRQNNGQPVTGLLPGGQYGPAVTKVGDVYLMVYTGAASSSERGLYAAISTNGRSWTRIGKHALVAPSAPPAFDSSFVSHACFLKIKGDLMVWYTGYRKERGGRAESKLRIGVATIALEKE